MKTIRNLHHLILTACTLLIGSSITSQTLNNIWYFGDGNFIDFNTTTPTIQGQGIQIATPTSNYCIEGTSSICNSSGQLLFYSDGRSVWDKNYNLMPNGSGLNGHLSCAQCLIVPKPGSSVLYYVFYGDYAGNANGFSYSEVDMSLNNGLGDVTALKNIQLHTPGSEMMKAVTHCNGSDIWVISHSVTGNTFRAYLVSNTGVSTSPVISNTGGSFPGIFTGMAYMTCSKDGKKIALCLDQTFELYDFDNQNGTLFEPISVPINGISGGYGIEFSANGIRLYVGSYNLHQFDISSNNSATIAATELIYPNLTECAALMRGPDNKIYIGSGCDYYDPNTSTMLYTRKIHVIQNPDLAGITASNLALNVFTTPRECGMGLPTCYYPTQSTNTCGPALNAAITASNSILCTGDCITYNNLSTGPAVSYIWTFSGGTPASYTGFNPPQICYASQGSYTATLVIKDCSGNTQTASVNITVNDCNLPDANFTPSKTLACEGDCITFTNNSTGTNIASWNWTFPGGNPATYSGQNPGNVCFANAGIYQVNLSITNQFGTDQHTIPVVIQTCPIPVANFNCSSNTVCAGDCITLTNLSTNTSSWNWVFNGGNPATSALASPGVCYPAPGNYNIQLTASNAFGSDVTTQTIIVHPKPTINLGPDLNTEEELSLTITATGSPGIYSWSPSNLFAVQNISSQILQALNSTLVIATVADNNNCRASDTLNILVNSEYSIFVPNSFSPNGDALNDEFSVKSSRHIEEFELLIFNRWGEEVFRSDSIDVLWNGKYKNVPVAEDVYAWVLFGKNPKTLKNFQLKGTVTLIR